MYHNILVPVRHVTHESDKRVHVGDSQTFKVTELRDAGVDGGDIVTAGASSDEESSLKPRHVLRTRTKTFVRCGFVFA